MIERTIYTDPETRAVFITSGLLEVTPPSIIGSSATVQSAYRDDPESYVKILGNSVRTFPAAKENDPRVQYSILHDSRLDYKKDRLTLVLAPLNDCAPQSSGEDFLDYLKNPSPKKSDREKAQPNSWRQIMKAGDIYETHVAEGQGRPVVVIYSPIPDEAFNASDHKALKSGIPTPFGKIAEKVIDRVQREIHGGRSETQYGQVDIFAPGMGHNAIGVAHYLQEYSPYEVTSLTTPNLIAGISNKAMLLARYSIRQHYHEPGDVDMEAGTEPLLPEAAIAVQADRIGSEKAMRSRQLQAMLRFDHLTAMMKSGWIKNALESLLKDEVKVTVPLAHNARITEFTPSIFPDYDPDLEVIHIRSGAKDKYADLMTNEYVTLGSILALRGARRALGLS